MVAAVLAKLLAADEDVAARLTDIANAPIRSRIGAIVGGLRPTDALAWTQAEPPAQPTWLRSTVRCA